MSNETGLVLKLADDEDIVIFHDDAPVIRIQKCSNGRVRISGDKYAYPIRRVKIDPPSRTLAAVKGREG